MKRKTKNENLAEEITHTIRTVYRDDMTGGLRRLIKGNCIVSFKPLQQTKISPQEKR